MSDLYCPLLSIVVPVYNVGGYLLDTLDSIAVQSYNNIEVICVDDGSTDGSSELLDLYASRDSRFVIYHEINRGFLLLEIMVSIRRTVRLSSLWMPTIC